MFDRPDRLALLGAAETALRDEVLPGLEGGARYTALMVASALAIARRELEAGNEPARVVLDAFAELYGQDNVHRAGGDSGERVKALMADLAREIRDGEYDDDLLGPIHAVLQTLVVERLKRSNPRFLEAREYSQPSRC
ncbi:MAG: DUF6285 domain-containing protein [Thalassobaculum sp.]|uniref:DUF6285 domain-containing protein n=1 Tax=Thalassobaculum sp. TaxID=2022740 RepID=UPI0032EBD98C